MTQLNMKRIYLYSKFERFWHWVQAVLITLLLVTGFEVHGVYTLFGFERTVDLHATFGISWVILYVFIAFWLVTTGEWKQYIPTTKRLLEVMRYYAFGIFRGQPHPVQKKREAKHNPLQRLTYLGLASVLIPIMLGTGLVYYYYNELTMNDLGLVANLHVAGAFLILMFYVVHVYMTTTGHSLTAHIQAMFTGWEEVEDESQVEDWERADKVDNVTSP
ncbi:MAG: cytochrome b/b6 domain-containing protein [Desulfovibrio sp.]|nr:cytochrome b/b6 domain-containing protein [Desulfovibrio sp.]